MPVHDWTRVRPGIFHAFHQAWIYALQDILNDGVLPDGYSALGEQVAGPGNPDLIVLDDGEVPSNGIYEGGRASSVIAVATSPPQVALVQDLEANVYARRKSVLTVRHAATGDRIVANIEIVSPGNKGSRNAIKTLVEKSARTLENGVHLLHIDLHPITVRDPLGIHALIWEELGGDPPPTLPKPLTMAAYVAAPALRAFVEPVAVGDHLKPMPLFLTVDDYVNVPLEEGYVRAFKSLPRKWRARLESP